MLACFRALMPLSNASLLLSSHLRCWRVTISASTAPRRISALDISTDVLLKPNVAFLALHQKTGGRAASTSWMCAAHIYRANACCVLHYTRC